MSGISKQPMILARPISEPFQGPNGEWVTPMQVHSTGEVKFRITSHRPDVTIGNPRVGLS